VPDDVLTRDRETPREQFGGFLALESSQAEELARRLAEEGVLADARGRWLRLGPAPYLSDAQLEQAVERLAGVLARMGVSSAP
jgi:kynureninase